ncbi:MAG: C4-type zinc ribbon domain-containing protein [Bacillota bacterium]|jgi:predicted  nucleic acid-binding Zn-ribbon protein
MAILPLLYRVQEIESRMAALTKNLESLAGEPNLTALQSLLQKLTAVYRTKEGELRQVKLRQRRLEAELQMCQGRLQHEEKRLYDGSVTQARELEQIEQKAAEYRHAQARFEEELLELMEADDKLTADLQALFGRRQTAAAEEAQLQAKMKQQSLELILEKEDLQAELAELEPQIPPEWLERYRRIARSQRGIGVAKLKQNSCGACHVSLSEFRLQQVKRGEDKLHFCENCGRILYYN